MNNSNRWLLIALGTALAVLLLIGVLSITPALGQGPMGGGMMGGYGYNGSLPFGSGHMMGNTQGVGRPLSFVPGWMRGNFQGETGTSFHGPGWMMGGMMNGLTGHMMDGGMMVNSNSPFYIAPEPLTLSEVNETLAAYLAALNDSNLEVAEVMIFDNHAYAQIVEKESGIGVLEVLVDPVTKAVFPEMGPNMMWNLKYGMMSGFGNYGMMGMRMGGSGYNMRGRFGPAEPSAGMTVTPEQAIETAQAYLNTNFSPAGLTADEHADPFYGYYTLHVNRDGQTVGMLSVNGYTGQVFPHTWHGELLEMSDE